MNDITISKQERLTVSFYFLSALLFLQFIPLPAFHFLGGIAFENFIWLAIIITLLFNSKNMSRLNSTNTKILSLLLIFYISKHLFGMVRGEGLGGLIADAKNILYITVIVKFCSNRYRFLKIFKLFVILAVISVIFGALVYIFGEPFATIRSWLTQSQSTSREIYIGKGSQLTGIYCPPAIFGYMMAVAPILCLALYYAEKKIIWIVSFMICILGLFLNAERAPMIMNLVLMCIWFWREKGKALFVIGIALTAVAFVGLQQVMPLLENGKSSKLQSSYAAGDLSKRMNETGTKDVTGRFAWQMHGIRTVMHHPLIGATYLDYTQMVYEDMDKTINDSNRLSALSKTTLAPHNHYVDIGMDAGVFGWLLLIYMLYMIIKITRPKNMQHITDYDVTLFRKALTMSLFAVLGVALFHNAGIFGGELATCSVLAFIMTLNNLKRKAEIEKISYGVS